MLKFIVCNCDKACRMYLKQQLESIIIRKNIRGNIELITGDFSEANDYLQTQKGRNENYINVYILDINSTEPNGNWLPFAKEIRLFDRVGYIIFTADFEYHGIECAKVKTFDFILKPIQDIALQAAVDSVWHDYIKNYSL